MQHDNSQACHDAGASADWFFRATLLAVAALCALSIPLSGDQSTLGILATSTRELMLMLWWGIAAGILMISILGQIPRPLVMSALGTSRGTWGIVRAAIFGVLLDLCSHGILMVGAKLYDRGASTGQVVAFLMSSPWNSFSLTLILIALIGLPWTLGFILLSMIIGITVGIVFDALERRDVIPSNPNQFSPESDFRFWQAAQQHWSALKITPAWLKDMFRDGMLESRMVVRWILLGVILTALIRALVPPDAFATWFGPTAAGLALTMVAATIIEVCSEGSTPIAADLFHRANAPGNGFAFLMAGVSTDYTELMVLRDTTRSWKVALLLPLVSLPQIILVAALINLYAT